MRGGYTDAVKTDAESLLPLPLATFHILVALANEDRHGYAVIKDVAARTGGALNSARARFTDRWTGWCSRG